MIRPVDPDRPAFVYRAFNADGKLLYIGMTYNVRSRVRRHAKEKPWWGEVADIKITDYATRDDAAWEERRAILYEHPLRNLRAAPDPIPGYLHKFVYRPA